MKILAFSLLAASLFFAACKKDDDNKIDASKSFTYNGEAVGTPNGYLINFTDGSTITVADHDLFDTTYSGTVSALGIDLDTLINGQTYTYKNIQDADYDKKKNFTYAAVLFKQQFADGDFVDEATELDSLIGGSVTYSKTENTYKVVYELKYVNVTVNGQYNGALKVIND